MLRKVLLTGIAFVAFGLTKFLFNILVIRRFSPALLGEINQTLSLFLFIPVFYAPGLGTVVSKFASEFRGANDPQKARQVFSFCFILAAGLAIVLTLAVAAAYPYLAAGRRVEWKIVGALAPMLLLYSLYVFLRTSYYGFDRVGLYLRNEIISSTVFFAVLGAAVATRSVTLAVLPFASHSVVFVALAIRDLGDQFRFGEMLAGISREIRRWGHFFFCTIINSLAGPGAFHLGIVLTGRLTGNPETTGYYSLLIYSLQPLNLLPVAVSTVLMPTISHHYGAGRIEESVESAMRAFRPLFLVMMFIWGVGAVFGREIAAGISATSSPEILIAFEVILAGVCLYLMTAPPSVLLNATRHISVIALGGAAAFAAALAIWWTTVPAAGLIGAAAGYGALQLGKGLWAAVAAGRIFEWRPRVGAIRAPALASAAIVLGAFSLESASFLRHAAAALVFALIFLALYARDITAYLGEFADRVRSYAARP